MPCQSATPTTPSTTLFVIARGRLRLVAAPGGARVRKFGRSAAVATVGSPTAPSATVPVAAPSLTSWRRDKGVLLSRGMLTLALSGLAYRPQNLLPAFSGWRKHSY